MQAGTGMLGTPPPVEAERNSTPDQRKVLCFATQQSSDSASMPRAWQQNVVPWDICPENRVFVLRKAQCRVNATIQKCFSQPKHSSY